MMFAKNLLGILCTLGAFALAARAAEPELHIRHGLPNLAGHAKTGGDFRIAYFGGSITAAEGWRVFTTAHLKTLFPKLNIIEIAASLPGTGSDLGACRFEQDALRHNPDLIFVEFAVNDANTPPEKIERTIEGIVRQAKLANPDVDLCFIYTISTPGLPELQAGRFPPAAQAMERVAAHYGIPSIHLGVEIAKRVTAHELVFKAPDKPDDASTFSLDGVHPTQAGHRVYFRVIERNLPELLSHTEKAAALLPSPLHRDNWEKARLTQIASELRHGAWTQVAKDDPNLRSASNPLLPPVWRTDSVEASIEFQFTGHTFGMLGIAAPDSGEFRVTVDDQPPVEGTFFDDYASPTFCRQRSWFYPTKLADGPHRVRVKLLTRPFDKIAIKTRANKPVADPAPYAPRRLALTGLLTIADPSP